MTTTTQPTSYITEVDESVEEYNEQRSTHVTWHALKNFVKSPAEYQRTKDEVRPYNDRFVVGAAVHCAVLEGPKIFEQRYQVGGPINKNTGKSFGMGSKKFLDHSKGYEFLITPEVRDQARAIFDVLYKEPETQEMLRGIKPEVTYRGVINDIPVQGRLDGLHHIFGIVDLKTIDDIGRMAFQVEGYDYCGQLGWYDHLHYLATGKHVQAHLIFVEMPKPGYTPRYRVYSPSVRELSDGLERATLALEAYKNCVESNNWPEARVDLNAMKWG